MSNTMTTDKQPERHQLQADGSHPSPCARFCEAQAFKIDARNLHARIADLEAQLESIGAGGVEPLRKRECLHQISEPAQAQPVASESLVKWASLIELAQTDWHTGYEAARAYVKVQLECATPQPAAPRNATLYNPDDVAFPVQRCADGTDAPTELTSIAAAKKGGQHGAE